MTASTILNVFAGGTYYYGFTVFFNPIKETFGWSSAVTSVAFSFRRLESGLAGPVAGFLVDKLGPRKLMLFGWFVFGLGFLWMSRIESLFTFYAAFVLAAIGASFGSFIVMNAAIAYWFRKKRSRAMSITYVGMGISGVLAPLLAWGITRYGWRDTLVYAGVSMWAVGIPLSLLMRSRPSQYGYLPDGEPMTTTDQPAISTNPHLVSKSVRTDLASPIRDFTVKMALRTRAFWLLAFVYLFQQVGVNALMVHLVPALESVNVPTTIAAGAVTGLTLFSLIGRLGVGFLGDFVNKRYLIAGSFVLQFIGLVLFTFVNADRAWLIVPFLLVYATGYGGPTPLRPAMQADYFGTKNFGTILGLLSLVSLFGGLASPVVAGWIFDTYGDYTRAWQLFALITLLGIPLILLAKPPKIHK
ncbi:MAG: MFS transporter [Chloroflexi bacterium]|nr:MFS transporter [Chloroflexota bacterium]